MKTKNCLLTVNILEIAEQSTKKAEVKRNSNVPVSSRLRAATFVLTFHHHFKSSARDSFEWSISSIEVVPLFVESRGVLFTAPIIVLNASLNSSDLSLFVGEKWLRNEVRFRDKNRDLDCLFPTFIQSSKTLRKCTAGSWRCSSWCRQPLRAETSRLRRSRQNPRVRLRLSNLFIRAREVSIDGKTGSGRWSRQSNTLRGTSVGLYAALVVFVTFFRITWVDELTGVYGKSSKAIFVILEAYADNLTPTCHWFKLWHFSQV